MNAKRHDALVEALNVGKRGMVTVLLENKGGSRDTGQNGRHPHSYGPCVCLKWKLQGS